jgi:hypothetical protein
MKPLMLYIQTSPYFLNQELVHNLGLQLEVQLRRQLYKTMYSQLYEQLELLLERHPLKY